MNRELHCYEYVNRPFDSISTALAVDAVGVFQRATQAAAGRAETIVSNLKVSIAGLEIGTNVVIRVVDVSRNVEAPGHLAPTAMRLRLAWQAETNRGLFPAMQATLYVYPLSATETQLDLRGTYEPPGGLLGDAADRLVGHRIAEASVHRFLEEVASWLGRELPSPD